jgi:hypothetical protein
MKEVIMNMKQMADHYFKIDNHTITLPEDSIGYNPQPPLERRKNWEEKKSKKEHCTAPYWGLERRRNWKEQIFSKIAEEKENKREHLTAIYWG